MQNVNKMGVTETIIEEDEHDKFNSPIVVLEIPNKFKSFSSCWKMNNLADLFRKQ